MIVIDIFFKTEDYAQITNLLPKMSLLLF